MSSNPRTDKSLAGGGFFARLKPTTALEHIERVHELRVELADAEKALHLALLEEAERKGSGADYGERQFLDASCTAWRMIFDLNPDLADAIGLDSWTLERGCDEPEPN